jgi:hypothetical protein
MPGRRKSNKKNQKEDSKEDLFFTLSPGNMAFSWNFKDHLAIFNLSLESSRISNPKTHKLRTKKDFHQFKESFQKNHSLDDEILKLFTNYQNGKEHQIRNPQNDNDFLSFCIQERTTAKLNQDINFPSGDQRENKIMHPLKLKNLLIDNPKEIKNQRRKVKKIQKTDTSESVVSESRVLITRIKRINHFPKYASRWGKISRPGKDGTGNLQLDWVWSQRVLIIIISC